MNRKHKINLGLIIGPAGFIAGIILIFMENWLIGISGSIASAAIAYLGYKEYRNPKN